MLTFLRIWLCGLHGHDDLRHFERTRLSLKCASCGRQTPGWEGLGRVPAPATPTVPAFERAIERAA